MKLHRTLAALALVLVVLAGCAGASSDSTNPNYAQLDFGDPDSAGDPGSGNTDSAVIAAPGGPTAVVAVATDVAPVNAVDEATLAELTSVYDRFLRQRANAIMGERDVADMADVATPTALAQVARLQADAEAAHAAQKYSALTGLFEWSNVTTIQTRGTDFVFTDCTERQELNSTGNQVLRFVTNEVVMVQEAGSYKIDQVTELQSGLFAEFVGDFGCVPPSFSDRAETVAAQAIAEVAAMVADPGRAVADGVPGTFTDDAHDELTYIVDLLSEQGLSRIADEAIQISVVGMDTNKPEFTVIVSVCRHYPNGRSYTDAATGATTVTDLARGSSEEEWLFVQLEPVPVGTAATDTVTRVEAKNTNCWSS